MNKGILFAFIAACISGISIFYNKIVVVSGIDPLIFNILKNGGVAICFTFLLLTNYRLHVRQLSRRSWIKLIAIGIIGGSIPFVLFFEGLKLIPAVQGNLIHKTLFLWVAMMAVPFLKERLSVIQILAYVGIAWATFFASGMPSFRGSQGELMILVATILWSIENIIAKIAMRDIDAIIVAWGRMFIGTIVLLLFAVGQQKVYHLTTVPLHFFFPIIGSIGLLSGYVYFWYRALRLAPATLVTSLLIISTPITMILSFGLLHQGISIGMIMSNSILVASVGLLIFWRKRLT